MALMFVCPLILFATIYGQAFYTKWLEEDVFLIISDAERQSLGRLKTAGEFQTFQDEFWKKRDPTPDTDANEFKDEHYARLTYADGHFGLKTDRGRAYVIFGPPEKIELAESRDVELWRYRWIEGLGTDIVLNFKRSDGFRLEGSLETWCTFFCQFPSPCHYLLNLEQFCMGAPFRTEWSAELRSLVTPVWLSPGETPVLIYGRVARHDRRVVETFEDVVSGGAFLHLKKLQLPPGEYEAQLVIKRSGERLETIRFTVDAILEPR